MDEKEVKVLKIQVEPGESITLSTGAKYEENVIILDKKNIEVIRVLINNLFQNGK